MAKTSNGVTTEYTTDLSSGYSQVLKAESDTSTVYYTRGFELISRREVSTTSYYIYDGGLSVRALTNEAGIVTDTLVFDAFGNESSKTGSSDNPYGFQGEEQDETGLYYLRARYMDPATGTFTTMDTYGGSLTDPMSLHKYLFANSNPVMYTDPSGHEGLLIEVMETVGIIGMLASATIFWIDNAIHPEKNYTGEDYLMALIGGFVAAIISAYIGSAFEGAAFTLSWNALIAMGCILFLGSIGYLIKSLGQYFSEISEKNQSTSCKLLGFTLETIGDGMMGLLNLVFSLNNDFFGFILDIINALKDG